MAAAFAAAGAGVAVILARDEKLGTVATGAAAAAGPHSNCEGFTRIHQGTSTPRQYGDIWRLYLVMQLIWGCPTIGINRVYLSRRPPRICFKGSFK